MDDDQSNTFYHYENDIETDDCENIQNVFSPVCGLEVLEPVEDDFRVAEWPSTVYNKKITDGLGEKDRCSKDSLENKFEIAFSVGGTREQVETDNQLPVPKPPKTFHKKEHFNVATVKEFSAESSLMDLDCQNMYVESCDTCHLNTSGSSETIGIDCEYSETVKRNTATRKSLSKTVSSSKNVYILLSEIWNRKLISKTRSFCDVRDDVSNHEIDKIAITVGSLAEGLYHPEIVFDVIFILKWIDVDFTCHSEETQDQGHAVLLAEMSKILHGRVLLQVIRGFDFELISHCCITINNVVYFSGHMFQMYMMKQNQSTIYSDFRMVDSQGSFTFTFALKCAWPVDFLGSFPRKVKFGWPSEQLVSQIKQEGLLLVPQGNCNVTDSHLHWQMLFTPAEKLLVRSFSHTQLLTLALLKIIVQAKLTDNPIFKNLSSSYVLKVVMFWVIEQTEESMWKHCHFLENVFLCFKRFMSLLSSGCIPNYFFPEQNILENIDIAYVTKIRMTEWLPAEDDIRLIILQKYPYFDKSLSQFDSPNITMMQYSDNTILSLVPLLQVASSSIHIKYFLFKNTLKVLTNAHNPFAQRLYLFNLAQQCQIAAQLVFLPKIENKSIYKRLRYRLSLLLMGTHTDLMSGWILMAFHLFKTNRFRSCLIVLDHIEHRRHENIKIQGRMDNKASGNHDSITGNHMPFQRQIKHFGIQPVLGVEGSGLIPKECVTSGTDIYHFSSEVLCSYLKFLCMVETGNATMCPEILIHAREISGTTIEMQHTSEYVLNHMERLLEDHFHRF